MDFELDQEYQSLQEICRRVAKEKVAPRAREIDLTSQYPQDIFDVFKDSGLLGLCIPETYGGSGAGILGLSIAIEEVAKYSSTAALMLLLTRLPTGPILIAGSEFQKRAYLKPIAMGTQRASFALSEPTAGSDVVGMRTRAVRSGDDWIISGTKCWISGISQADWYTVFAKTGDVNSRRHDSITAFIVDRNLPGVSIGRLDKKMGVHGVDTGELILDEVRVKQECVIGDIGGFKLAMLGLNSMRPIVAARGLGLAEGALMYAVDYIKSRDAFGKKISDFQGIRWEVAKMAAEMESARLLTYRAAIMADNGKFDKAFAPYLSMAKYCATEVAVKASGLAVQLLGAAGYMQDHPTEMLYRDAKQLTIVEGSSQVQLGLIGKGVIDRDVWWD